MSNLSYNGVLLFVFVAFIITLIFAVFQAHENLMNDLSKEIDRERSLRNSFCEENFSNGQTSYCLINGQGKAFECDYEKNKCFWIEEKERDLK